MPKAIDLTGQVFGRLTAIEPTTERRCRSILWRCFCSCGEVRFVSGANLRRGDTRSCGCLARETCQQRGLSSAIDLTGQVFGRLLAVEATDLQLNTSKIWRCVCQVSQGHVGPQDKECFVKSVNLRSGKTASCGCLKLTPCPYSALRLEELYKNGLSVQDIANLAGTTRGIVTRWLAAYQVEKRSNSEAKRVRHIRFPNNLRKMRATGLAVRLGMWKAGLLNTDHLHTASVRGKRARSYLKTVAARRAKQQAEREQSEAIERALNGDTFK